MAALREIAKMKADLIREGTAWLIVWKVGRSWNAEQIYLDTDGGPLSRTDCDLVCGILEQDPDAILLNGIRSAGFWHSMSLEDVADTIRWHYEEGHCLLRNSKALLKESGEVVPDQEAAGTKETAVRPCDSRAKQSISAQAKCQNCIAGSMGMVRSRHRPVRIRGRPAAGFEKTVS